MWIYIATGVIYLGYQIFSGNYRQVLFTHRDIPGVWPMVKHYFFFGPEAGAARSLQPATETRLHNGDRAGRVIGADRVSDLEAGAVFVAGVADGRLSLGAVVAFRGDVGDVGDLCLGIW